MCERLTCLEPSVGQAQLWPVTPSTQCGPTIPEWVVS